MSEAKFTKGEWEASTDPLDYGLVRCDGVAVARGHSGSSIPYTEKIIANAHLIAAAPEMYEMLDNICTSLHSSNYGTIADILAIEALLAKARGKA